MMSDKKTSQTDYLQTSGGAALSLITQCPRLGLENLEGEMRYTYTLDQIDGTTTTPNDNPNDSYPTKSSAREAGRSELDRMIRGYGIAEGDRKSQSEKASKMTVSLWRSVRGTWERISK